MDIILQRLTTSDNGTFGILIKDDRPFLVTLELPWKDNQRNISCIPAATYKATKVFSEHFQKYLFILSNIVNRDAVEMHIGNDIRDTHGCILLGMQYSLASYAIVNSKLAFDSFMSMMPDEFNLIIVETIYRGQPTWT